MKILVLGATGRTGKYVIEEALRKGHKVSAIVRDPQKLKGYDVEITEGTPYDYETVKKAMSGCDAVINVLNVSRTSDNFWAPLRSPKDMISASAANAVMAMEKCGVTRFVALGAIGAGRSWKSIPWIMKLAINGSNLKYAFEDHGRQEKILEDSAVDYTVCRAPMLAPENNDTGAEATPETKPPASMSLSRNSAAEFFIRIIENKEYIRQMINLANKPK